MSGTPAQIKTKFATWPNEDWYGKCAGVLMTVCRHFGDIGDGTPYSSATAAYNATRIESTDATLAPAGAVHHWAYYGTDWQGRYGNWGHVGIDMYGGGTRVLNATRHADEAWGLGLGLSTVAGITGRVGGYLGWSRTYGRSYYATITIPTVTNPNPEEYPDMFIAVVNQSWFLVVPQGTAKPRAVVLGGESQADKSGLPVVYFTWPNAIAALKRAVDGIA